MILFATIFSCHLLIAQHIFEVSPLGFNTRAKEMAPAFFQNGLVFISDKRNDILTSYVDQDLKPFTNLYFAAKKKQGKFESPRLLAKELTTFLFEGPATFSADGKEVFFTRSIDVSASNKNSAKRDTTFGIFSAKVNNGTWSGISSFSYNSSAYNTGYPYLTDDGKRLYFCSDMPGGYGGFDIYVSERDGNVWGEPVNLGAAINTPQNEVFPFYQGGRLYFASRGHKQQGDLDIYFSAFFQGVWQQPMALGEPFNTGNDDYGLVFNATADTGYFVSDRNGSADIFGAYSQLPTFTGCNTQKENDFCYVFYESNSEIDTLLYAYEWDMGDGTLIRAIEAEHCFKLPGTYLVQLNVIDKITNDFMVSQATYSFVVEKIEQPYITAADTVVAGGQCSFSARETYFRNFEVNQYFWDFGDGSRAQGVDVTHTFILPGTYLLKLGVTGSATGDEEGNPPRCVTKTIVVVSAN